MIPYVLIVLGAGSIAAGVLQLFKKPGQKEPASEKVPSFQPKKKSEEELKGE